MLNPLISVIIPVYNPGKHLVKCLDSVVNQTYKNLEIILVNDGSTDNSADICRKYADKDPRIVFISRENRGVSATRNEGISIANGDFFLFLDSDDYLEIDTFEYLLNIINEKKVDSVNFEYYITYSDNENIHQVKNFEYGVYNSRFAQNHILSYYPFACNKLFSKRMIKNLKFNEEIARGEDTLFALSVVDTANCVWFDKRPLLHYVQSEESAVRGRFRRSQLSAVKLYEIYKNFYLDKYPELYLKTVSGLNSLMISLYFDMWNDSAVFKEDQKMIKNFFNQHYMKSFKNPNISVKNKIKFTIFRISPSFFCFIHKRIFKL